MILNKDYEITNVNNMRYLVNISNGDVYEINDVVEDIVLNISQCSSIEELANFVYEKYKDVDDSYTKDDLKSFLHKIEGDIFYLK